jgi:ABC-type phosphate transport system substrate-binding protein
VTQIHKLTRQLGAAAAVLGLAATTTLASAAFQPAAAANQGIYGGGAATLSFVARQLFDCYQGSTLPGDSSTLPSGCLTAPLAGVEGLYASVNSGSAVRAFIANDPFQLLPTTSSKIAPYLFTLPTKLPVYLDTGGGLPDAYPYPELDFAVSDTPLPTALSTSRYIDWTPANNWQTLAPPPATPISAEETQAASYLSANWGQPIQIPGAEVAIAIGVNAPSPSASPWQIEAQKGSVIQLSAPQLCAIFSGAVTNWGDATTKIEILPSSNVQTSELFAAGNTPAKSTTPYFNGSLAIDVVYRSDSAGTTYVLTNFLSAVCPEFDTGSAASGGNGYAQIFTGVTATNTTPNLPSNSFSTLISNINSAFPSRAATTAAWTGVSGNSNAAAAISNYAATPANQGRIGYVSVDLTQPYTATSTTPTAPLSAAVQDEYLREKGVNHPGDKGTLGTAQYFVAPNPASTAAAWTQLIAPTVQTYTAWNVYAQTHVVAPITAARSILATPTDKGAYPIAGTSFLNFYSCYAPTTTARVAAVTNFLSWFLAGSDSVHYGSGTPSSSTRNAPKHDPDVATIIQSNGFNPIPETFADNVIKLFVNDTPAKSHAYAIEANTGAQGCKDVTGGAH